MNSKQTTFANEHTMSPKQRLPMSLANERFKTKPVVSYWRSGDPCKKLDILKQKLTEINIIHTKNITQEFADFCLENKHRIFLHVVINGMGGTMFEPKIPSVKKMFNMLHYLLSKGFRQQQILVIVNPILPNDNGLKALSLLLRVFTEFKELRLRTIRFNVLTYTEVPDKVGKFQIGNENIRKRQSTKYCMQYLIKTPDFWKKFYALKEQYHAIIGIDSGESALIGINELIAFGINNDWVNEQGKHEKIINYKKGNRFKPIVNIISGNFAVRCSNRCLLCPWKY